LGSAEFCEWVVHCTQEGYQGVIYPIGSGGGSTTEDDDDCNTDSFLQDVMRFAIKHNLDPVLAESIPEDCSCADEGFDACACNYVPCSEEVIEQGCNVEFLIEEDLSFTNCRKVSCMYNLMNEMNNELFCETFGSLFDDDNFTLKLKTAPRNTLFSFAEGMTSYSENTITITLADDLCDSDDHPLEIAGVLLHEAIHATMYQQALTNDPMLESNNYCQIWQDHFQSNDPCHEVMANQYVDALAEAISEMDYMYMAWTGLSDVGDQIGLLVDPYIGEYYSQYQTLIDAPFEDCN